MGPARALRQAANGLLGKAQEETGEKPLQIAQEVIQPHCAGCGKHQKVNSNLYRSLRVPCWFLSLILFIVLF